MNESETRAEHIDPALTAAGWGVIEGSRIRREHPITLGRIEGHGKRGKALSADYVLEYRNTKLAVVEAKAWDAALTEGVAQAKNYAGKLSIRFTYATNGQGIYGIDMETGNEAEVSSYPTPDELWAWTFAKANAWRDRFAEVPFPDKSGSWTIRFYQEIAVNRVLECISSGKDRILLTLATGTGKTSIAFQIAWKLFQARWNLSGEPTRRPRILFLADRNTLANQAYNDFTAFSAFKEDALARVKPEEIRNRGRVPKNANVFFTIFQTFMASAGSATGDPTTERSIPELVEVAAVNYREPAKVSFEELSEIRDATGYMYILECADGSFYTGSTSHLAKRLVQHGNGEGALHTERHLPVKLVYYETFDHVAKAFEREKQIQRWSRAKKIALIRGDIDRLKKLARASAGSVTRESAPEPVDGYFGEYPADFFDFIVIDECHRGGANDESSWRDILNYFSPAVQLGLTATPRRKDNVDTYAYFGEPVFIYSLKEGINDGFLTPFKVKQISTTIDYYTYTSDDTVEEGEIEVGKVYDEPDFNKNIEIREREKKRVEIFMEQINQNEKTLVFCATQNHALIVRDMINQMKASRNPDYCQRVTADDGALGEQHLKNFQNNENTIPTILTTSQKLSTGVDARNVRNIVLMRPVKSMIEFKQIIGRGTRLYDGKDYFTVYDFVKAHLHFADPEWDGEPLEEEDCPKCGDRPCTCEVKPRPPCEACGKSPCECPKEPCEICGKVQCTCEKRKKAKVKLADGKERNIQHMMMTTFWHPDGAQMSAQQFMDMLFGKLPEFFSNEDELRELWSVPATRSKLLEGLEGKGFGHDQLAEMQKCIDAENSDLFDVLAHVAYALPTLSREQRAAKAKVEISTHFNSKQQVFLDFVLSHYISVGVEELEQTKLAPLLKLRYHNSINDAVADLGEDIGEAFTGFQKYLYQGVA